MSNYDIDALKRQERCERFEHAINCMDISPLAMMSFERIALDNEVSLTELLQIMLLDALDRELTKGREMDYTEGLYG